MNSTLLINQLVVVGRRKNYVVGFNRGVNIIYGDSATGKSSILNLIDYLLGAGKFDSYTEIEEAARYAVLDVMLNNEPYSIKRDIFDASSLIEVYQCGFDDISVYPCKKYLPSFRNTGLGDKFGFFSDFLLDSLNLTNLKIKSSPSKDASKLSRLSFRDIIRYCYVDQDDLGSKRLLNRGEFVREAKHAQVFKYIFNALDEKISDIEQAISSKTQEKNSIEGKFKSISEFLRESDFGSMLGLDEAISRIDSDVGMLSRQLDQLNKEATADDEVYRAARSSIEELGLEINLSKSNVLGLSSKIERFTRLKNDYLIDISKFKSSQEARVVIGEVSGEISLCPVCDNELEVLTARKRFDTASDEKINHEINTLKHRVRSVESFIGECRTGWEGENVKLVGLGEGMQRARSVLDIHMKDVMSPYISERDTYVSQLGALEQNRKEVVSRLKIRNQHRLLDKQRESLELSISKLKELLEKMKEEAPSLTYIAESLADNLRDFLKAVKIKDPTGVSLTDKKFFPVVRGIEYQNTTSGGLRTIIGIGYFCSLLKQSLVSDMSYPPFLMIDTVGKYLGKTKDKYMDETSSAADAKEGVSDPEKYQNIFEYFIDISEQFEDRNEVCQIILVDNDVPQHIAADLDGFVVAHFSSVRANDLPVGFIDDAK